MAEPKWPAGLHLFFPARCCCCGGRTANRALICDDCRGALPAIPERCCRRCGQVPEKCECGRLNFAYAGIAVPFYNAGAAKRGVYAIKTRRQIAGALYFGACVAERFRRMFPDIRPDTVTAVPMRKEKLRREGFNHAEALAKVAARRLGLPFDRRLLYRNAGDGAAQHTLDYGARMRHVRDLYGSSGEAAGKTVLLIDDIRTTGATLDACARALAGGGAKRVYCAAALLTERKPPVPPRPAAGSAPDPAGEGSVYGRHRH